MATIIPCKNGHTHELMNPLEASVYMGVSIQTLNRYRLEGYIRSFKWGRGNGYTKEGLDDALVLLRQKRLAISRDNLDREEVNLKYV